MYGIYDISCQIIRHHLLLRALPNCTSLLASFGCILILPMVNYSSVLKKAKNKLSDEVFLPFTRSRLVENDVLLIEMIFGRSNVEDKEQAGVELGQAQPELGFGEND